MCHHVEYFRTFKNVIQQTSDENYSGPYLVLTCLSTWISRPPSSSSLDRSPSGGISSRNALRRGAVGDTIAVSRSAAEAAAVLTTRLSSVVVFRLPVSTTGSGGWLGIQWLCEISCCADRLTLLLHFDLLHFHHTGFAHLLN